MVCFMCDEYRIGTRMSMRVLINDDGDVEY
jgi:hypothetical protein